jgi:hypothetical protein
MIYVSLAVSLILATGAILLTVLKQKESIVSLSAGAVAALMFGISEMRSAVVLGPGIGGYELHLIASILFTTASALFLRLAVAGYKSRAARASN